MSDVTRRSALVASVVAVAGGVLGFAVARNSDAAKARGGAPAGSGYDRGSRPSGQLLAKLDRIPHNGGVVIDKPAVVLTRGAGDEVHAFSAVCTHLGCLVDRVGKGTIDCPCHGSRFDATTGKVVNGPASTPLEAVAVTVRDGGVYSA